MVRSVEIAPDRDVSAPPDQSVEFYRDNVLRVLNEAGRRVTLDVRDGPLQPGLLKAGEELGVPLRISSRQAPDDRNRSDPGPEMPRSYYWELPGEAGETGSLPDAESIGRVVGDLISSGSAGFEIELPSADPDFAREDLPYWWWGRLGYDPKSHDAKTPDPKSSNPGVKAAPKSPRSAPAPSNH
jgi:hypothetical protein